MVAVFGLATCFSPLVETGTLEALWPLLEKVVLDSSANDSAIPLLPTFIVVVVAAADPVQLSPAVSVAAGAAKRARGMTFPVP